MFLSPWRRVHTEVADMAALGNVRERLGELRLELISAHRLAEDNRVKEYNAAVSIQSWFRGCKVRAYLRYLHKMVTVIQKWWRGYVARKYFRSKVKTAYFIMKMNFYNETAVRIQKRWRGYFVRKYVHNYYALKRYLEGVTIKNNIVRKELDKYADIKSREQTKKTMEKEEREKDYRARKTHYLLSTEQIPGVYNSPYRPFPDAMEIRLQKARPLSHNDRPKKMVENQNLLYSDCRDTISFPIMQPLPPIGKKKPQGPFRDTAEVLQQRYKPLEPTLRVATSINSVEEAREELKRQEWRRGIHEKSFATFSSFHKTEVYEPLIHTSSDYTQSTSISLVTRMDQPEKWIAKKDFHTVFTLEC
ncbi:spermatogenesis-associated protein 17 isoform X2 [Xenopus laevis]|uniref:Spermatogenesis-associated protein 17 isoform X2 n=1 Tax=Xenopus laevis TaxID=8355 RepID=A0A8J0V9G8_XENLA|nr:spermatogenesis-associated protein 17 isoform X2 [Xenopus laevis]